SPFTKKEVAKRRKARMSKKKILYTARYQPLMKNPRWDKDIIEAMTNLHKNGYSWPPRTNDDVANDEQIVYAEEMPDEARHVRVADTKLK
ncbi:hypothetical protein PMAYCL1PPCAC_11177, partial [Pristionchus mayeri]